MPTNLARVVQLTRLRNLISLQLANNRFSGGLENQQVPLSLFSLNMSSNLLTGQVPNLHHELFPALRVIDLSNNKIEGYVPDFLETADKVAGMNWVLSGNPLWCPIPPWKVLLATTCQRVRQFLEGVHVLRKRIRLCCKITLAHEPGSTSHVRVVSIGRATANFASRASEPRGDILGACFALIAATER